MSAVALGLLSESPERVAMLQNRLDATGLCHTVLTHTGFPSHPTDTIIRRLQDAHAELVVVDLEPHNLSRAAAAIELLHAVTDGVAVLAVGNLQDPPTIVSAMRAGAREFIDRNPSTDNLIEALTRLSSTRSRSRTSLRRARLITVATAKGGSGGTTVAVNLATSLQRIKPGVLLIDLAHLGHAALHLNVHPSFGVIDALQSLHRLDTSLLDSLLMQCKGGLKLLAGLQEIRPLHESLADFSRLFEHLSMQFDYVVVDASGRADQTVRSLAELSGMVLLVAQTDIAALWSASRLQTFLETGGEYRRVQLVLNRYRKIPGLSDEEVERLTNCPLLWKVPNNYHAVSASIDKGVPLALQDNHEIAQSFRQLAERIAAAQVSDDTLNFPLGIGEQTSDKPDRRFLVSALRPGQ